MKYLMVLILGFFLNSGMQSFYSYMWWKAESKFTNEQLNKSYDQHGYFKIIYDEIGLLDNIKYILVVPKYTFQKWKVGYP